MQPLQSVDIDLEESGSFPFLQVIIIIMIKWQLFPSRIKKIVPGGQSLLTKEKHLGKLEIHMMQILNLNTSLLLRQC